MSIAVVRVLLVDDQAPFLLARRAVLDETNGFAVVGEASSGEQPILAAQELVPDLLLMDVNLLGWTGQRRRRLRSSPSPPVVLLLST